MNEKLIEDWYSTACCDAMDEADDENFDKHLREIYAELLIKECINVIEKCPRRVEPLGGQRFSYIQLGETVMAIKNHFGIEEHFGLE